MRDPEIIETVQAALRAVGMMLPHLSGLAALVRVEPDPRVATAGMFASGRLVVNPQWFTALAIPERIFVAAHELMHLALRSHDRAHGADPRQFNIAHDYIINDMLRVALDCPVPAGGLDWRGARMLSAEEIAIALRRRGTDLPTAAWRRPMGSLGEALARAGLGSPVAGTAMEEKSTPALDVLDESIERDWFPHETPGERTRRSRAVAQVAENAVALGALREQLEKAFTPPPERPHGGDQVFYRALGEGLHPPWERALQRWMDEVAPQARTYARASRRQGTREDVVLPGARREGWRLNLVLDTSGSMTFVLPTVLGVLRRFCESAAVSSVRVLQCGETLEVDEVVTPSDLSTYAIRGGRDGDLKPGLYRLADDPAVEAALVVTDGCEDYPRERMPYAVLWAVPEPVPDYFQPSYGTIVPIGLRD